MSDYHILTGDSYANAYSVVMHFPVPDTTNEVGTSYRVALVESRGLGSFESAVPWIDAGELTQLQAGELIEYVWSFHSRPGETTGQKRDRIDTAWENVRQAVLAALQNSLSYWGYDRDVPA